MKKVEYFFVNKSVSSDHLTQSSAAQRSAIQKYVQNGLPRPRKLRNKARQTNTFLYVDDRALYNRAIRHISCKLDAFGTASIEIDCTVQFLLHYYIFTYQWTLMTNTLVSLQRQPHAFRDTVVPIVQNALEDELTMYCLLTAAVCRVRHHDCLQYAESAEHRFMAGALHVLQTHIAGTELQSGNVTDRLVGAIMFLGVAESFRKDYRAARTHLTAISKLLGPDGISMLQDKNLQEQLLLFDLVDSSLHLEPCRFVSGDDPGPVEILALTDEELDGSNKHATLGTSLLLRDDSILPSALMDLIMQVLETYDIKRRLKTSSMSRHRAFETSHWVTKRNRATWKRLLDFPTCDKRIHTLRTALILWILQVMTVTGRVRTIKVIASRLQSSLDGMSAADWSGMEDIRLWILLMGYHCAEADSEVFGWFAEQVRIVQGLRRKVTGTIPGLGENLFQVLAKFQCRFLYDESIQRPRTEKLAQWLDWWIDLLRVEGTGFFDNVK